MGGGKWRYLTLMVAIVSIAALGITYFIFVRQDGSVLLALSSVIGGIAGYHVGKARGP